MVVVGGEVSDLKTLITVTEERKVKATVSGGGVFQRSAVSPLRLFLVSAGVCHLLHVRVCSADGLPVHVQRKRHHERLHGALAVLLQCQ